jgi:hypothetical protein
MRAAAPAHETVVAGVTRIEEADIVAATCSQPRPVGFWLALLPLGTMAVGPILGFVLLLVRGESWGAAELAPLGMAPLFAAVLVFLLRARTVAGKKAYAAMPEWQRQVRYEVRDAALRVRTEHSTAELEWGVIIGWREVPTAFYLQQTAQQIIVMPKRAFETEFEVEEVRAVLRAKVKPTAAPKPFARALVGGAVIVCLLFLAGLCALYYVIQTAQ